MFFLGMWVGSVLTAGVMAGIVVWTQHVAQRHRDRQQVERLLREVARC